MPNTITYTGPESVKGPAGAFTFSMLAVVGPVTISISSEGSVTCSLSGNGKVIFSGGGGTCVLTGVSDDTSNAFDYFGSQTLTQRVSVDVPSSAPSSPSSSPSLVTASAAAPAPAAPSSSAAPQAAPASSAVKPTPKPTTQPSTSARASASATPSMITTAPSTQSLSAQTVTWSPTTSITTTTPSSDGGREFTPSTQATTSGNGAITYSIGSPNTSFCHLRAERIVVVGQNGTCTVIATAAATSQYSQGSTSVTFTISNYTDPRPAAPASPTPSVF